MFKRELDIMYDAISTLSIAAVKDSQAKQVLDSTVGLKNHIEFIQNHYETLSFINRLKRRRQLNSYKNYIGEVLNELERELYI
jgi:hypothetical protein